MIDQRQNIYKLKFNVGQLRLKALKQQNEASPGYKNAS